MPFKKLISTLCVGAVISVTGLASAHTQASAKLVLKPVNTFNWVYDDSGTGANLDLSIWRPHITGDAFNDGHYYSLGDIAVQRHGNAPKTAFVVKELEAGVLAKPTGYTKIWDDSGSGGSHDVKFWRPNAPAGYTCLGHVAVRSYSQTPSTDWIRCVKSEYVVTANAEKIWDDAGSGADDDAGVWRAVPQAGDEAAQVTNAMITRQSHSPSGETFHALNKAYLQGNAFAGRNTGSPASAPTHWQTLAAAFAPNVYMHASELFFPASVEHHLASTTLETINNQQYRSANLSCDICYSDLPFLYGSNPSVTNPPMYAAVIQKNAPATTTDGIAPTDTVVDIVYFMFYPYNQGKYINPILWDETWYGNHVGDWEHLTLRFVNGYPYQIFLSQHSGGAKYDWGHYDLTLNATPNNFHPSVFAAKGSHAIYADAGSHTYQSINYGVGSVNLTDEMNLGPLWQGKTNLTVIPYQTQGNYSAPLDWMNYQGRWGNSEQSCIGLIGVCRLEDGPTGPMQKSALNPASFPLD